MQICANSLFIRNNSRNPADNLGIFIFGCEILLLYSRKLYFIAVNF
jgi:hypothetical protein